MPRMLHIQKYKLKYLYWVTKQINFLWFIWKYKNYINKAIIYASVLNKHGDKNIVIAK